MKLREFQSSNYETLGKSRKVNEYALQLLVTYDVYEAREITHLFGAITFRWWDIVYVSQLLKVFIIVGS